MKKKIFAVALAAVMTITGAISAFAAEITIDKAELAADSYTEYDNALKGSNPTEVTVEYTINFADDAARNGWDGVFAFFNADTNGRLSFQTAPFISLNTDANAGADIWIDAKADAYVTANCEPGTDYTFKYVINKDSITVSVDGKEIAEFAETGRGANTVEGYQDILDAINTYPTFTLGVGTAKSSFWNTEICTLSNVKISDGNSDGNNTEPTTTKKSDNGNGTEETTTKAGTSNPGNNSAQTGDVAPYAAIALMLGAAVAVVVLNKKKV